MIQQTLFNADSLSGPPGKIETRRYLFGCGTCLDLGLRGQVFDWSMGHVHPLGCFDCAYCRKDEQSLQAESGKAGAGTHFRSEPTMPVRAPVRGTVAPALPPGPAGDPYATPNHQERTRRVLTGLLTGRGRELTLVTRSTLVAEDIRLFRRLAEQNTLRVMIHLATLEEGLIAALEPKAPSVEERLSTLARLCFGGVSAGLLASPIIPGLTDSLESLEALVSAACDRGARPVLAGFPAFDEITRGRILEAVCRYDPVRGELFRNFLEKQPFPPSSYLRVVATRLKSLREKYGLEEEPACREYRLPTRYSGLQLSLL